MAPYYARNPHHRWKIRVELDDITPPIWREFSLPAASSFGVLHHAIQDAMGWTNSHLHQFCDPEVRKPTRLITDPENFGERRPGCGWEDEWVLTIKDYIADGGPRSLPYQYDFGDDWIHTVTFLESYETETESESPLMIGGARACPPEDCGGVYGYEQLVTNPESMKEWITGFDPDAFDPAEVVFQSPFEDQQDD